jgi:hypothetical protein
MVIEALNAKLREQEQSMAVLKLSHISKETSADEIWKVKANYASEIENFES